MIKAPWLKKQFVFDTDPKMLPLLIERLRGTHLRLLDRTERIIEQDLTKKVKGKWSINEHVGHLLDMEELWEKRIEDYKKPSKFLSPADMQNKKTENAQHNAVPTKQLIAQFVLKRQHLIEQFESLADEQVSLKLHHQRLNVHMNAADTAYFIAEHDDHHLASITELRNKFI